MTDTTRTPAVLFVCSKNGGKSQIAAGLGSGEESPGNSR